MAEPWIRTDECDAREFRNTLGSFLTGVTVVATYDANGAGSAFTANSFTSVSLDPPLILVCLGKSYTSIDNFLNCEKFSVSFLGEPQRDLSSAFASRDPEVKGPAIASLVGDDCPYVEGSLTVLICERHNVVDAGDHIILIGRVERFTAGESQPLGFYRGAYVGIGPDVREIEQLRDPLIVGGILSHGGKVLLCRQPGSETWDVPSTKLASGERHGAALHRRFRELDVEIGASVPYSLFQEPGEKSTTFYFWVQTEDEPETGSVGEAESALFDAEDEPWTLVHGELKQAMIKRFFDEMAIGRFGVYFDMMEDGGVVALGDKLHSWQDWNASTLSAQKKPRSGG